MQISSAVASLSLKVSQRTQTKTKHLRGATVPIISPPSKVELKECYICGYKVPTVKAWVGRAALVSVCDNDFQRYKFTPSYELNPHAPKPKKEPEQDWSFEAPTNPRIWNIGYEDTQP